MNEKEFDESWPLSLEETQTPWLLYTHDHDDDCDSSECEQLQVFYSPGDSKSYMKSIPELCHKETIAFFHGWLILRDQEDSCIYSLFNITTLQTTSLPRLPTDDVPVGGLPVCLLTSSPSPSPADDNCMFLLSIVSDICDSLLFFCRPWADTCDWVVQSVELEDGTKARITNLVTLNGVIYGCSYVKDPVSNDIFYIVDELNTLTIRPLQIGEPNIESETVNEFYQTYLLESCGCIYYAKILYRFINKYHEINNIVAIRAWELNLEENNWMELKSLNGRAFLLNPHGSTWCWGNNAKVGGIQENCVCFPFSSGLEDDPNIIVSVNLVDQTWTVVSPSPNLVSPDEYYDNPVWVVMPRLQLNNIPNPNQQQIQIEHEDDNINEEAQEEDISCWFDKLPLDMIQSLPNYMHLFEYWKFRASCKMFHTALPEPLWRTKNEFPLFLFFKNEVGLCKLMDPCRNDVICSSTLVPFSQDRFTLIYSKNGWLLSLVAKCHMKFYNLFTGVTGVFPPLFDEKWVGATRSIAFSSNPTSSDCLTVALLKYPDFMRLCYLQSGDDTWEEIVIDIMEDDPDLEFRPTECAPIYLGGAFYFPDCLGNLGVFEIVNDEPSWQVYDMPNIVDDVFESCHLVDCEGELYIIYVYRIENCRVQVFRFDGTNKSWVVINDIGNHIFFISKTSCCSIVPSDPTMRNRIYLSKIEGKNIVFYSLDTKMYHILGSGDSRADLYGTNQPLMCCWV